MIHLPDAKRPIQFEAKKISNFVMQGKCQKTPIYEKICKFGALF
jgi:hypothetical protein